MEIVEKDLKTTLAHCTKSTICKTASPFLFSATNNAIRKNGIEMIVIWLLSFFPIMRGWPLKVFLQPLKSLYMKFSLWTKIIFSVQYRESCFRTDVNSTRLIIAKERVLKKENQGTIFQRCRLLRRYFASNRCFYNFRSWICALFF